MSSTKHAFVVDEPEDDTSRPRNDRRQTRIDKSTNRETEKGSPKITERPTGRKQKGPSRVQGKGSSPRILSVRKNTTRSASRRNSKAQPKASTKSSTNPPKKPPKVVRFDVAGSQDDQAKGKQLTTTVEEQDSLEGARALKVMPDPTPSFLTQEDLEQMLPPKPLLPRTDAEFEDRYRELKTTTMDWVKQHFLKDFAKPVTSLDLLQISKRTPELIQYINFIASSGRDSWEDIFVGRRMALVYGVLAKAIEIHVFGEEMFGASDMQRTILRQIDLEMLNLNGRRLPKEVISLSYKMRLAHFHPIHRLRPPKSARWYHQRLPLRPRPRAPPGVCLLPCPAPGASRGSCVALTRLPSASKIPP